MGTKHREHRSAQLFNTKVHRQTVYSSTRTAKAVLTTGSPLYVLARSASEFPGTSAHATCRRFLSRAQKCRLSRGKLSPEMYGQTVRDPLRTFSNRQMRSIKGFYVIRILHCLDCDESNPLNLQSRLIIYEYIDYLVLVVDHEYVWESPKTVSQTTEETLPTIQKVAGAPSLHILLIHLHHHASRGATR